MRATARATVCCLLDASALIAAGNVGGELLRYVLSPPRGVELWTTDAAKDEVRFTAILPPEDLLASVRVAPAPERLDPALAETHGTDFTPPSRVDMGLLQLAKDDARFSRLVSGDGYHRKSGLAWTLRIADRLRVIEPSRFVKLCRGRESLAA